MINIKINSKQTDKLLRRVGKDLQRPIIKTVNLVANHAETQAKRKLRAKTKKITGQLARSIFNIKYGQFGKRVYVGKDYGKYIEFGRKEVKPKKAKLLYIPISTKAKRLGSNRNANLEFGTDFVFAKKAKAMKPRPFWRPAMKSAKKKAPKIMKQQIIKHYG